MPRKEAKHGPLQRPRSVVKRTPWGTVVREVTCRSEADAPLTRAEVQRALERKGARMVARDLRAELEAMGVRGLPSRCPKPTLLARWVRQRMAEVPADPAPEAKPAKAKRGKRATKAELVAELVKEGFSRGPLERLKRAELAAQLERTREAQAGAETRAEARSGAAGPFGDWKAKARELGVYTRKAERRLGHLPHVQRKLWAS